MASDVQRCNIMPAEVFHPSLFILEEMDERGWDRDMLATKMVGMVGGEAWGIARLSLDFYLDVGPMETGLRIGTQGATEFARAFGTSAEFWLDLEAAWLRGASNDAR